MENLKVIAHIHTGFKQKFGIPRQNGLVNDTKGQIVFEKEFRDPRFIEGLESFDYIWLLWEFSANKRNDGATVRPPRLGGRKHMGVFATRAPFRPNNIGLSSVKIEKIEYTNEGPVINVTGVDMLDGTPIFDIKPYLPYADSHPGARAGFSDETRLASGISVDFPDELKGRLPMDIQKTVEGLLEQDPRAAYDKGKSREFSMCYGDYDIKFIAEEEKNIRVTDVVKNVVSCDFNNQTADK